MSTGKKVLFIIVGIILIALSILLFLQAAHYGIADYNGQIAQFGFYKSDVSILTAGQKAAEVCCWIFAFISLLAGGGAEFRAVGII